MPSNGPTVLILSKNATNLNSLLNSIHELEGDDFIQNHVLVVDDGVDWDQVKHSPPRVEGAKPFCYSRNVNIGIRAAGGDVILCNDDVVLETAHGFTNLWKASRGEHFDLVSSAVKGLVCNPKQHPQPGGSLRAESYMVAFVCVAIPRQTIEYIGLLDERLVGYGCDDSDYCMRVLQAGRKIGIFDGCVVNHCGTSSFRTRPDHAQIYAQNRDILASKWNGYTYKPADVEDAGGNVEILYTAFNRLEFVQETFSALISSTDWYLVRKLWVYDDGSTDGTKECLFDLLHQVPVPHELVHTSFGSPITAMGNFINESQSKYLVKIDSDIMCPPGWLQVLVDTADRCPEYSLIGIEPIHGFDSDMDAERRVREDSHIGGIGLFRRDIFSKYGVPEVDPEFKYGGFQLWQANSPDAKRGWLEPGIPVVVLDKVNAEPWRTLNHKYVEKGWARSKPRTAVPKSWEWTGWGEQAA